MTGKAWMLEMFFYEAASRKSNYYGDCVDRTATDGPGFEAADLAEERGETTW